MWFLPVIGFSRSCNGAHRLRWPVKVAFCISHLKTPGIWRWLMSQMRSHVFSSHHHTHAASKRLATTVHNTQLLWQAVDSCSTTVTTSTHPEQDVRVGNPAVRRADAQTRVQFTSVPQVANAQKHCFQLAGLLIINELLHHWQISLISQGRAWERTRVRAHTHPQTHTHARRGVCMNMHVLTPTCILLV